jgi:hypothetical protein
MFARVTITPESRPEDAGKSFTATLTNETNRLYSSLAVLTNEFKNTDFVALSIRLGKLSEQIDSWQNHAFKITVDESKSVMTETQEIKNILSKQLSQLIDKETQRFQQAEKAVLEINSVKEAAQNLKDKTALSYPALVSAALRVIKKNDNAPVTNDVIKEYIQIYANVTKLKEHKNGIENGMQQLSKSWQDFTNALNRLPNLAEKSDIQLNTPPAK